MTEMGGRGEVEGRGEGEKELLLKFESTDAVRQK